VALDGVREVRGDGRSVDEVVPNRGVGVRQRVDHCSGQGGVVVGPGCSPRGDDIAPIPGTKQVARLEENAAADRIELTAGHVARLNDLPAACGERYDADNMAAIDQ
jgi:hypothetical protein